MHIELFRHIEISQNNSSFKYVGYTTRNTQLSKLPLN